MKNNREYEIAWQGLKPGVHVFQYDIDDHFIAEKQGEVDFKDLKALVKLRFDKKTNFFLLHFDIDGSLTVPCDRCGDEFEMRLWDEFDLLVKLAGEDAEERDEDADAVFIPRSETVLDISDWLFEFITLSIPLQKVHPDKEEGSPGCNPQALNLLHKLSEHEEETKHDIWKGLDALKKKENKS
jgi:uncharacterized metal-binding protein YceD (DUF177 family)